MDYMGKLQTLSVWMCKKKPNLRRLLIQLYYHNISNKSDRQTQSKSPVKLILHECKSSWSHLKFRSIKRFNCSINKCAVHRQERLLALCIIKKCRAGGSVSSGADAAYSIPDRLTDGVQNRLTATCLFSSFLGSKSPLQKMSPQHFLPQRFPVHLV